MKTSDHKYKLSKSIHTASKYNFYKIFTDANRDAELEADKLEETLNKEFSVGNINIEDSLTFEVIHPHLNEEGFSFGVIVEGLTKEHSLYRKIKIYLISSTSASSITEEISSTQYGGSTIIFYVSVY